MNAGSDPSTRNAFGGQSASHADQAVLDGKAAVNGTEPT